MTKLGSSIGTDRVGVMSRKLTALGKAVDSEHQKRREAMKEEADRHLVIADRDREIQA